MSAVRSLFLTLTGPEAWIQSSLCVRLGREKRLIIGERRVGYKSVGSLGLTGGERWGRSVCLCMSLIKQRERQTVCVG